MRIYRMMQIITTYGNVAISKQTLAQKETAEFIKRYPDITVSEIHRNSGFPFVVLTKEDRSFPIQDMKEEKEKEGKLANKNNSLNKNQFCITNEDGLQRIKSEIRNEIARLQREQEAIKADN